MEMKRSLYFDNHATTPLDPRVLDAMLPYFREDFGNAGSSHHAFGWKAKSAIEKARKQVAHLIGAQASEIIFTSGATESIHTALLGYLEALQSPRHLITANSEHKATLEVFARAEKLGHDITILPVDRQGCISVEQVEKALRPNTALVSLMHANNEIGTVHPIREIGALLEGKDVAFHVDAAQTAGREPIDVTSMGIDLLSISAHKFYGPKGVGALFIRRGVEIQPYLVGGGQERGLRGGTHNVPGIVGLGEASALASIEMGEDSKRLSALRDRLIDEVSKALGNVSLNGHPSQRLCNNVSLTFFGVQSDQLLLGLNDFAYSSASACSSGGASHVLKAIGQETSDPFATTARFGLGRFTKSEDVDYLIERLTATVRNARDVSKGYQAGLTKVPGGSNLR